MAGRSFSRRSGCRTNARRHRSDVHATSRFTSNRLERTSLPHALNCVRQFLLIDLRFIPELFNRGIHCHYIHSDCGDFMLLIVVYASGPAGRPHLFCCRFGFHWSLSRRTVGILKGVARLRIETQQVAHSRLKLSKSIASPTSFSFFIWRIWSPSSVGHLGSWARLPAWACARISSSAFPGPAFLAAAYIRCFPPAPVICHSRRHRHTE